MREVVIIVMDAATEGAERLRCKPKQTHYRGNKKAYTTPAPSMHHNANLLLRQVLFLLPDDQLDAVRRQLESRAKRPSILPYANPLLRQALLVVPRDQLDTVRRQLDIHFIEGAKIVNRTMPPSPKPPVRNVLFLAHRDQFDVARHQLEIHFNDGGERMTRTRLRTRDSYGRSDREVWKFRRGHVCIWLFMWIEIYLPYHLSELKIDLPWLRNWPEEDEGVPGPRVFMVGLCEATEQVGSVRCIQRAGPIRCTKYTSDIMNHLNPDYIGGDGDATWHQIHKSVTDGGKASGILYRHMDGLAVVVSLEGVTDNMEAQDKIAVKNATLLALRLLFDVERLQPSEEFTALFRTLEEEAVGVEQRRVLFE